MINGKWTETDSRNESKERINDIRYKMETIRNTLKQLGIDVNPLIFIEQYRDLLFEFDEYYQQKGVNFYWNGSLYGLLHDKLSDMIDLFMDELQFANGMTSRSVVKVIKCIKNKEKFEGEFGSKYCSTFNNISLDNDEIIAELLLNRIRKIDVFNFFCTGHPIQIYNYLEKELISIGKKDIADKVKDRVYDEVVLKDENIRSKIGRLIKEENMSADVEGLFDFDKQIAKINLDDDDYRIPEDIPKNR